MISKLNFYLLASSILGWGSALILTGSFAAGIARADSNYPAIGTITRLQMGDLMCYGTVVDDDGKEYAVGATFEICTQESELLNQRVHLSFREMRVNDCQSNEPCGKTRLEMLLYQAEIADPPESDSIILSNGKWRLEIGNLGSWNGMNGTGNVSYRGCDDRNNCIDLTGGKVTCRDGLCRTVWQNGEYFYELEQFITEEGEKPANLRVRRRNRVILQETGFRFN